MAKNIFQDFTWTDRKSRPLYSPSNEGAPTIVGYQTARIGGLSALGRALSGIAAPFAGDFQYGQKQYEADLKQQQADMEFAALLEKNRMMNQAQSNAMKNVYTTDAGGNLVPVGVVPKGSQVISNPNAPTADMKNQAIGAQQARILWDELKSQSQGLKGGYEGMFEMGKAALNRGKGESGNYSLYTENLPSSAVSLYRALTGDTRLSDSDAKSRALPLLWQPSQDVSLRTKKNEFIDKMVMSREKLLLSGKYKDGVIPLVDLKKEASNIGDTKNTGYSDDVRSKYNALREKGVSAVDAKKQLGL